MLTNDTFETLRTAIRAGEVDGVSRLLTSHPDLATSTLGRIGRTPLHVVTDWPGFFPNAPKIAELLIEAGAQVDARGPGRRPETPLHWAASSDDADVARVLIDAGADLEAANGSIGTPLANAVGYACWNVARLLVANGAKVDNLWQATALGLTGRIEQLIPEQPEQLNQALWHACAGGQRRAAERMVSLGADLSFTPDYGKGTVRDIAATHGTQRNSLIEWLGSIQGTNRSVDALNE